MSKLNSDAELVRRIRITKPTWLMPCQNCGYVGSHTKRSCNEIEEEQRKDLNEAADLFTYYSDDAHESHPWHSHPHIIRNIATSLERDISGLHQFCCETFQLYSCGKEVNFKDGLIPLIEYHKSRRLDIPFSRLILTLLAQSCDGPHLCVPQSSTDTHIRSFLR